jgi:hypothetical protein
MFPSNSFGASPALAETSEAMVQATHASAGPPSHIPEDSGALVYPLIRCAVREPENTAGARKLGGCQVRKLSFGGANSLDNYLAHPDHAVDWLMWGEEAGAVMAD